MAALHFTTTRYGCADYPIRVLSPVLPLTGSRSPQLYLNASSATTGGQHGTPARCSSKGHAAAKISVFAGGAIGFWPFRPERLWAQSLRTSPKTGLWRGAQPALSCED